MADWPLIDVSQSSNIVHDILIMIYDFVFLCTSDSFQPRFQMNQYNICGVCREELHRQSACDGRKSYTCNQPVMSQHQHQLEEWEHSTFFFIRNI